MGETMKSQYETKYTNALVVISVVTIIIFLFVDSLLIETIAFTALSLFLTLNFYEAYIAEDKKKHKFKLILSLVVLVIFIVYLIYLLFG